MSRRNVGEADVIGRVLLESGFARDIRVHGLRKSRARTGLLLEPGSLVQFTYYEREERPGVSTDAVQFASLKEGHVVERFAPLKDSGYDGLLVLSYFLELARFGSRAGEAPELFLLLKGTLEELCILPMRGYKFILLSIFFKVRVLKTLGLVGDARVCSECGREINDLALWNLPEIFFSCEGCAPDANAADAYAARVIASAYAARFSKFAEYLAEFFPIASGPADSEIQEPPQAAKVENSDFFRDTQIKLELPSWISHSEERLLQCIEFYQGGPLRAATQLREQLKL